MQGSDNTDEMGETRNLPSLAREANAVPFAHHSTETTASSCSLYVAAMLSLRDVLVLLVEAEAVGAVQRRTEPSEAATAISSSCLGQYDRERRGTETSK